MLIRICLILLYSNMAFALNDVNNFTFPTNSEPNICKTLYAKSSKLNRNHPNIDDTVRLQNALDSCKNGQAVLLIKNGKNDAFYTNSLLLSKSGLIIDNVSLLGGDDYVNNDNLILIKGTGLFIYGKNNGEIDGRGDLFENKKSRLIQITNSENIVIKDITLKQSIHPSIYIKNNNNTMISNVLIDTPADRKNADGIDIDSSSNITVIDSTIHSGDDGIAIKTNNSDSYNILIKNNRLHGSHGLSIGSIYKGKVENVLFDGNYVYGENSTNPNGINIKTGDCSLQIKNITYKNTCLSGVKHLINITNDYGACNDSGNNKEIILNNINIIGVIAINSQKNAYSRIYGSDEKNPIQFNLVDVSLDNINQKYSQNAVVGISDSNYIPAGKNIKITTIDDKNKFICHF